MLDCDFYEKETVEQNEQDKEFDYCTNPLEVQIETKNTSWLDDFGWI